MAAEAALACLPLLQLSVFPGYLCKRRNELWIPEKLPRNLAEPAFCSCYEKNRQKGQENALFQGLRERQQQVVPGSPTNGNTLPADS